MPARRAWKTRSAGAAIFEIDPATRQSRLFASGLRNPNGLAWQPDSGALWTTVNERDFLGSDLVPDYMTSVEDGRFTAGRTAISGSTSIRGPSRSGRTSWRKQSSRITRLARTPPRLGLAFYQGKLLPERFAGGAFIAQHGSWNRRPLGGFKVIFVPFEGGRAIRHARGHSHRLRRYRWSCTWPPCRSGNRPGRRVLVADDVGNTIWRIAAAAA